MTSLKIQATRTLFTKSGAEVFQEKSVNMIHPFPEVIEDIESKGTFEEALDVYLNWAESTGWTPEPETSYRLLESEDELSKCSVNQIDYGFKALGILQRVEEIILKSDPKFDSLMKTEELYWQFDGKAVAIVKLRDLSYGEKLRKEIQDLSDNEWDLSFTYNQP